jgi:hypothetical protein
MRIIKEDTLRDWPGELGWKPTTLKTQHKKGTEPVQALFGSASYRPPAPIER